MDSQYRQSAVYAHFSVLMDMRFLLNRCVDEASYKKIKKAMSLLSGLSPESFAEDRDGKIKPELVPLCTPIWKD